MADSPIAARAEAVRDDLIAPATASRELIEYSVLGVAGLGDVRDRLVADSNAVAARARRRVTELLTERHGGRRPQLSGWHSLLVFLLTFASAAPLALLGSLRLGAAGLETPAAIVALVVGILQVLVALAVFGKPVPRSTLFQSQVSAALAVAGAVFGASVTSGSLPVLFLVGAAGSVIALVAYLFGRRDRDARQRIDDALETAFLDVSAEVAAERARLQEQLTRELSERRADVDGIRALRSASIALLREMGNPAVDDDPASLPGTYLIAGHTSAWLPPTHRDRGVA